MQAQAHLLQPAASEVARAAAARGRDGPVHGRHGPAQLRRLWTTSRNCVCGVVAGGCRALAQGRGTRPERGRSDICHPAQHPGSRRDVVLSFEHRLQEPATGQCLWNCCPAWQAAKRLGRLRLQRYTIQGHSRGARCTKDVRKTRRGKLQSRLAVATTTVSHLLVPPQCCRQWRSISARRVDKMRKRSSSPPPPDDQRCAHGVSVVSAGACAAGI